MFPSNSRRWKPYAYTPADLRAFRTGLELEGLPLYVHSIYLINLAAPDDEIRRSSSAALAYALFFGALTGAAGVVTHVGSHKGTGFAAGLERVRRAVRESWELASATLDRTAATDTGDERPARTRLTEGRSAPADVRTRPPERLPPLLLETSAGSKNTLGRDIEELAEILEAIAPLEAGVCLDTAHLYASGVPVHKAEGLEQLLARVEAAFGLDRLGLMHLNDCRTGFGSQHDQHANLGDGQLGDEALRRVIRHPALARLPFILEVPGIEADGPDLENVRRAQRLRAGGPLGDAPVLQADGA